jgi:peptidoglycan/xylan/chitin deacetylase (PgdA/CDA1 family)
MNVPLIPIILYHHYQVSLNYHIEAIQSKGYEIVHLSDEKVQKYLLNPIENDFPSNKIILTFDDGFLDFLDSVDILQKMGATATLCVPTGYMSVDPTNRKTWEGSPTLTWDELRVLKDQDIEIIPHSVDHFDLNSLDTKQLESQIEGSKRDIQINLEIDPSDITSFCFPHGSGWKFTRSESPIIPALEAGRFQIALRSNDHELTQKGWGPYAIPRWDAPADGDMKSLIEKISKIKAQFRPVID